MKKTFIVAAILTTFFYSSVYSQQWIATYNGTANGDDKSYAITVDSIGNIYMAGYITNNSTGVDMCVVKLNSSGTRLWAKYYDGPAHADDKAYAISVDKSLNVYITGYSTSVIGKKDYTTIKYNSSGTQQWIQSYNTTSNKDDEALSMKLDDSSNVYITGYITLSNVEIYTVKYNKNGVFQWGQTYEGPGMEDDKAYAITVDASRSIYVTGYSKGDETGNDIILLKYGSNGNFQWASRQNGTANADDKAYAIVIDKFQNIIITGYSTNETTGYDYTTIKYNPDGDILWNKQYNALENSEDRAYAIIVDSVGNTYVTGSSKIDAQSGAEDILSIRYNINGNEIWTTRYNDPTGNDADIPYSLLLHPIKNSIYVCGTSKSNPLPGSEDIIVLRYNSGSGTEQQKSKFQGTGSEDDAAYAITIDKFGDILIGGYESNLNTHYDFVAAKYSQGELIGIINTSTEVPQNYGLYQNFPNPFNPVTNIKFDLKESNIVTFKVYDVLGRETAVLADEYMAAGSYELSLDFSNHASGIYFYEMRTGIFRDIKKMVLVK